MHCAFYLKLHFNGKEINIGPCSNCIATWEPLFVFVFQLPGTMCSDHLLLKALENQAYIIMILLSLCGIKIFLGISTIVYIFYPNIESFLRRTRDKVDVDDEMSIGNHIERNDEMLSNIEKQVPVLFVEDEKKSQEINYCQKRKAQKIDEIFGLHATIQWTYGENTSCSYLVILPVGKPIWHYQIFAKLNTTSLPPSRYWQYSNVITNYFLTII